MLTIGFLPDADVVVAVMVKLFYDKGTFRWFD